MPVPEHAMLYVAAYTSLDTAQADYASVTDLYAGGALHTYKATVLSKELDGRLNIVTASRPDRGRAWIVLGVGALAGLFFPPCLVWADPMSVAAGGGETLKHFWRGLTHGDLRTIAGTLRHSPAAMIVISETTLEYALSRHATGTFREFRKALVTGDETFTLNLPRSVDQWLGAA